MLAGQFFADRTLFYLGHHGVTIFFVLSGFLIGGIYYKKENISLDEIMFIEMIDKHKSWQLMTDEEKFQDKKQSYLINIKFDGASLEIEYEKQIIVFLEKVHI